MNFPKNLRGMFLTLLIAAMLLSIQSPVFAQAVKSAVAGTGTLALVQDTEVIWADGAGNFHYSERTFTGEINLAGDGISLEGTQILVLQGYEDTTHSGPFTGVYTVQAVVNGEDRVWTGRIEGYSYGGLSYARIVAQEEGEPTGSQIKLNLIEFQLPSGPEFQIYGQILERP